MFLKDLNQQLYADPYLEIAKNSSNLNSYVHEKAYINSSAQALKRIERFDKWGIMHCTISQTITLQ